MGYLIFITLRREVGYSWVNYVIPQIFTQNKKNKPRIGFIQNKQIFMQCIVFIRMSGKVAKMRKFVAKDL